MTKSTTRPASLRPVPESQLDKFKQAAKELEADEDEARWDEKLKKISKVKPKPEKPE